MATSNRNSPEGTLRPQDAAEYLGVTLRTLYRLAENDPAFPKRVYYTSRFCFYNKCELDEWLRGRGVAV